MPGQELPPHKHPGMNLFIHVLNGSGLFITDDTETEINENDILDIEEDEMLSVQNNSQHPL
ncbi:hypothetical protein GCM10008986_18110 [Salinibacillus aidingensis]|uniref:Cupin type-2 domain-containing protein n=1 Tax=Salinibacillus aidingensis TaxID=237684 RepID=A0ABN1B850_9BACI